MTTATLPDARQHPDWNRSFALGTAIAINLVALGALAVMQPSWQPVVGTKPAEETIEAYWLEAPPALPPVPLAPPRATSMAAVSAARVVTAPLTPTAALPTPMDSTTPMASTESAVVELPGATVGFENVTGVPADRDAGVALADPSPPPYPIASVRKRQEGTVLLEVMVSASGAVTEVRVLRGSGHRELDRSARDHLLRAWSFQPALRNGQPVAARVRIPIEFSLATR